MTLWLSANIKNCHSKDICLPPSCQNDWPYSVKYASPSPATQLCTVQLLVTPAGVQVSVIHLTEFFDRLDLELCTANAFQDLRCRDTVVEDSAWRLLCQTRLLPQNLPVWTVARWQGFTARTNEFILYMPPHTHTYATYTDWRSHGSGSKHSIIITVNSLSNNRAMK